MLYDSTQSGGVTSDVGSVLRTACEDDPCASKKGHEPKPGEPPPTRLETSILSSGPDVHGRNWVPENPQLVVGKQRLRACAQSKFYVPKETAAKQSAVAVFVAIGSQYEDDAETAQESKGTACSSGQSHEGKKTSKGPTAQERAATAAAVSLLASQAKGEITGLRATFDVTGMEGKLKGAKLQADVVNEVTQQKARLDLPVSFESQ